MTAEIVRFPQEKTRWPWIDDMVWYPSATIYVLPVVTEWPKALLPKGDGAESLSGLRADPGAVPGASTLAA